MGPTGTGKTYSLGTAIDSQPECEFFILFTENALETILGYWTDRGKPIPSNLHWHMIAKSNTSFDTLLKSADSILMNSQESLYKMNDPNRIQHNQFNVMLKALSDFPDDRTGEKFGAVDKWGPNRCLVLSTLSGINPIAMSLVIGSKPVKSQAEWGIAQDLIERLIRHIIDGCRCHFILEAHIEREVDQVLGGVKLMASTLGRALAPKLPPLFSDVVLSVREGLNWSWSTANTQADLKTRNLAISDKLSPDFKPVFAKWRSRGGRFTAEIKK